jgi:hypothetical protein
MFENNGTPCSKIRYVDASIMTTVRVSKCLHVTEKYASAVSETNHLIIILILLRLIIIIIIIIVTFI